MLVGETIRSGAPTTCPECDYTPEIEVLLSGGGYYIGTFCMCGPYTRESEYYSTREQAQGALDSGLVSWRSPKYNEVIITGTIRLRDSIPIDHILGDHTINCILSNNCDGYDNCEPTTITINHTRFAE
jgi:hypothetical protein